MSKVLIGIKVEEHVLQWIKAKAKKERRTLSAMGALILEKVEQEEKIKGIFHWD